MSDERVDAAVLCAAREAVIGCPPPDDFKTHDRIRLGGHDKTPLVRVAVAAILAERNRVHKQLKGEDE